MRQTAVQIKETKWITKGCLAAFKVCIKAKNCWATLGRDSLSDWLQRYVFRMITFADADVLTLQKETHYFLIGSEMFQWSCPLLCLRFRGLRGPSDAPFTALGFPSPCFLWTLNSLCKRGLIFHLLDFRRTFLTLLNINKVLIHFSCAGRVEYNCAPFVINQWTQS